MGDNVELKCCLLNRERPPASLPVLDAIVTSVLSATYDFALQGTSLTIRRVPSHGKIAI